MELKTEAVASPDGAQSSTVIRAICSRQGGAGPSGGGGPCPGAPGLISLKLSLLFSPLTPYGGRWRPQCGGLRPFSSPCLSFAR